VRQSTLRATHQRLSPAAREASARYVEELWEEAHAADAEIADEAPAQAAGARHAQEDEALLARAEELIRSRRHEATALRELVGKLKEARRVEDKAETARLNEQLLDYLYDFESE
jgi:hypothetical protein